MHVLAYKAPKTPFFTHKYLTRYTHEMFFEECTNFEAHYLSHCWAIPLQSFGSHIRPQPHGLGLMYLMQKFHLETLPLIRLSHQIRFAWNWCGSIDLGFIKIFYYSPFNCIGLWSEPHQTINNLSLLRKPASDAAGLLRIFTYLQRWASLIFFTPLVSNPLIFILESAKR